TARDSSARDERPAMKEGAMKKVSARRPQREPSARSLREMPEVDFSKVRTQRNKFAKRVLGEGLLVQVGRGRPRKVLEAGGTVPRSVRFSPRIWEKLEQHAEAKGLTLHAALREAILDWLRRAA
ncbi:MAG: hypothetical protein JW940_30680, partial [Polyangiaceae bacterium]|nr:hypothetical protein [Polyangiaceae bacterium]